MRRLEAVWAALLPAAVARVVVLGALALARYLSDHLHPPAAVVARVHQGLLGWDAGYYRDIAVSGYAHLPRAALRFFPLLPLTSRWLADLTGLRPRIWLLVVANVSAVVAGALLYRLAVVETGRPEIGRRAAWFLALAPSAFVFVMGYAEGLLVALGVGTFLALRSRHWWWAALVGYLGGLSRPLGALLSVPAVFEAARGFRGDGPRGQAGRVVAAVAPVAGAATYLGWVAARFGDFWLPVRIQESGNLRGRFRDPLTTAGHDFRQLFHGHIGTGLHAPWLVVLVGLLVVVFRRWPLAYGLYALAVLGLAVSSSNFDSLERYGLSAFPLVLAAAGLVPSERTELTVSVLLGAVLLSYSLLAFTNAVVP